MSYKIVRMYFHSDKWPKETIREGLTLEEAQEWCSDTEGSSRTCKLPKNVKRTQQRGPWFEGYEEV